MRKIKIHIFIATLTFLIFSIFLFGKTGNPLIDFSREIYIPYQLLNGEKLLKNIFQIYGFWGYFINEILYKILPNFKILLLEAHILSYFCMVGFYLIAINYTKRNIALIFTLFFISINIFSNSIFSFVMPYSYSMLWAILASIYMFYFLIKKKYKLMFLFLGLIFINRIELFILLFGFTFSYLTIKKIKYIKSFPYLLIFPCFSAIYLIFNKITTEDIINNFKLLKIMTNTEAIECLYKLTGVFFSKTFFLKSLEELIIFILTIAISCFLYKKNYKIASIGFFATIMLIFNQNGHLFCLGAILTAILATINIKKLKEKEILIVVFSIILSSKAIFNTSYLGYSNFGYIFILFSCYIICSKFISKKYLTLIITTLLITQNISNILYFKTHPKYKTKTSGIYLTKDFKNIFDKTNEFITKNIDKNENFIVLPEGQIFNYIHKKQWGFYNSTFTPLDFETFGDKNLIENLKKQQPQYIIFFPRNTVEYGKAPICHNYGVDFCVYVMDNYTRIAILDDTYKVLIFKKNEK